MFSISEMMLMGSRVFRRSGRVLSGAGRTLRGAGRVVIRDGVREGV